MILNNERILVICPHTDDGEFGCAGTMAKLIEAGKSVYITVFSSCERSVPEPFPKNILQTEFHQSCDILGIPPSNRKLFNYDVRKFSYHRQQILEDLINLRQQWRPDLVFIPSKQDIHQDHSTVHYECMRAFKFGTIISYELPWNNYEFQTNCYVSIDDNHLHKKMQAIDQYHSQKHRPYANPDFIRSLALVRGLQCGHKYAECFTIERLLS